MAFYHISTIPKPLSIVWCKFPLEESPKKPGPKSRPALVRLIMTSKCKTKAAVEVTYGTSRIREAEFPYDLVIQNFASIEACGLPRATRFQLDKTILLPWNDTFFECRDGFKTPVIGQLDQLAVMQLEAIKAKRAELQRARSKMRV